MTSEPKLGALVQRRPCGLLPTQNADLCVQLRIPQEGDTDRILCWEATTYISLMATTFRIDTKMASGPM